MSKDFIEDDLRFFAENPHRNFRFRPLFENERYQFYEGVKFDRRTNAMWKFIRRVPPDGIVRYTVCADVAAARAAADDDVLCAVTFDLMQASLSSAVRTGDVDRLIPIYKRAAAGRLQ